jgi:hypothetical protein
MKRFVMTIALTCALSASALAGDVPTVGVTPPPPPPPDGIQATSTSAPGDVPSVGLTQEVTQTALTLIQSILAGVV